MKNGPFSGYPFLHLSRGWTNPMQTKPRSSQLGLLASYGMPGEPLGPKRHALLSSGNPRKIYPCIFPTKKNDNLMTPECMATLNFWRKKLRLTWNFGLKCPVALGLIVDDLPPLWSIISKSIRITQTKAKNKTKKKLDILISSKMDPKKKWYFSAVCRLPWCANALGEGSKGCRKAATLLCLNSSGFSKKSIPLKPHRIDSWFCWGKCTKINIFFF